MGEIHPESLEFADRIFWENVPYSGSVELTHRCNLSCRHCYQFAPRDGELDTAQWIGVLEDLAGAGCLFLGFTGGEPLLREDLPELISAAAEMGYVLTIQTNGVLVDAPFARMLGRLPTLRADVSVYGATPATHDGLTGVEGSFAAALHGIRLLREHGVPTLMKVTVGNFNLEEVEDMARLARELDTKAVFSSLIFPRNDRNDAPASLRLDDAGLERYIRFESEHMLDDLGELLGEEAGRLTREDLIRYLTGCVADTARGREKNKHSCGGGRTAFSINPYGDVYPCVAFPLVVGNVKEDNFSHIWKTSPVLARLRREEEELPAECTECDLLDECGICRALSFLEAGRPTAVSRERCRQTRARSKVLGYEEEHGS